MSPKTITIQQAAAALSVHESTVRRWIKAGTLTAVQGVPGGHWRIPLATLREKWGDMSEDEQE